jgi:protein TonB
MSLMALTVDEQGRPRNAGVVQEAGHGLDRKAYEAVEKYRFTPATLDGKPVPARIHIEVTFKIY